MHEALSMFANWKITNYFVSSKLDGMSFRVTTELKNDIVFIKIVKEKKYTIHCLMVQLTQYSFDVWVGLKKHIWLENCFETTFNLQTLF